MEMGGYKYSDRFFVGEAAEPWRTGARFAVAPAHTIGVATSWSPEVHFRPAQNFTYTLRWRWVVM